MPKKNPKRANRNSPIGLFDSGVGGLTVLAEVLKQLPHENAIYLADTARVPYGGRSPAEILKINCEILNFFAGEGVKLVIMACGTSSAIAYQKVKDQYDFPIVSMIEPGARAALSVSKNKKIGVIATQNTISTHAFKKALPGAEVTEEACPLFVPLIEGGFIEAEETRKVAEEYLAPIKAAEVDTLILGCTHYPHLAGILRDIIKVELIDPAIEAVAEAKSILASCSLFNGDLTEGRVAYYVTGSPAQFEVLGSKLLGKNILGVKKIDL
ncbi:glutamate racemase [candidate division WOR-1 bacterium RIFOXYA12_FULL_43_27]|uniref:Glutamate racemase n=1 Tax=candidate division WOR-1 bacterium RIFOXYC2_FULL_46_14 TaxID=1802587 RepID=A0A1F4U6B8_UNCSA|nr:MAG: glutamate racemase [candidate division WOR-1 bacterium RIFOXYA12_FULL_43_27]OGC20940.1 MAG: glutamate racemase [candidate division WOR-1 bacterium RIFOXYB2_FULL_46_45]OGC32301.1 MAG: glutamate racemase [candidate division WOR-1 bacterium RIFOXYA2_FULL_46_56]OGC40496.1 MAG: glutamate racemase [candidate division WOR-1 bacterium RIFOXYC2_FULL_46_14]